MSLYNFIISAMFRGYAEKDDASMTFWPTPLGEALIGVSPTAAGGGGGYVCACRRWMAGGTVCMPAGGSQNMKCGPGASVQIKRSPPADPLEWLGVWATPMKCASPNRPPPTHAPPFPHFLLIRRIGAWGWMVCGSPRCVRGGA